MIFSGKVNHCEIVEEDGEYRRFYAGNVNETESGKACMIWMDVLEAEEYLDIDGVGGHNYCRNPRQSQAREYCYISQNETEFCKVRTCEHVDVQLEMGTKEGRQLKQLTPYRSIIHRGRCSSFDISDYQKVSNSFQ